MWSQNPRETLARDHQINDPDAHEEHSGDSREQGHHALHGDSLAPLPRPPNDTRAEDRQWTGSSELLAPSAFSSSW